MFETSRRLPFKLKVQFASPKKTKNKGKEKKEAAHTFQILIC